MLQLLSDHIILIGQVITALGIIGGAIWFFYKSIRPSVKKVFKSFDDIQLIKEQVYPNGGTSLRDSVNRIEKDVREAKEEIFDISNDAARMDARQWAIVASLKDPIWEFNATGQCIRANSSLLDLVERSNDEMNGHGWENIIHNDDKQSVYNEWRDAVNNKRSFERKYRIVAKQSGKIYEVTSVRIPYHNPKNMELLGFIGRFINVKPLKERLTTDSD